MDLYNLVVAGKVAGGGGGGDEPVLINKNIDANGTYNASSDSADGYKKVVVSVPSSGITPSGTKDITSNGIYDVTNFASASVSVSGIVPSGTSSITANGIYDITNFASVDVNVSGGGGGDAFAHLIDKTISGFVIAPSDISKVYANIFTSCSNLQGVEFTTTKENVSAPYYTFALEAYAFSACSKLETVVFSYLTTLGENVFRNCPKLESVIIKGTSATPPWTYANTFSYTATNVYVPASQVEMYKTNEKWVSMSSRIFAIEDME